MHLKSAGAIESLSDLKCALDQEGRFLQEVDELLSLSRADGSWLAELDKYARHLFVSPQKQKEKKALPDENHIAIVDLASEDQSQVGIISSAMVELWLSEFCALIERHRETSAEF